ncbi:MerR family DNA-binding transcriptional regulator [Pediococcus claussenii]|nr:MerR family DNA-binding transcriptional regulator [Pediococcus claussenii]
MKSSEVSKLLNISIDTLRYYEKIGIIPTVSRDKNGYRDYQTTDYFN